MNPSPIYQLPEELQVQIFRCLDSTPPSEINARKEPSLRLTDSDNKTFKDISLVSKRWRRIVLPLLFKNCRLRLDAVRRPEWSDCHVCGDSTQRKDGEMESFIAPEASYHAMLFDEAWGALGPHNDENNNDYDAPSPSSYSSYSSSSAVTFSTEDSTPSRPRRTTGTPPETLDKLSYTNMEWTGRFYHGLVDFIDFISRHGLARSVESFTLLTDRMLHEGRRYSRFPHSIAKTRDSRYRASTALWRHLLSVIDLPRIVIVAPPVDLACLTNCAIDLFGDWAFSDMDYHILSLSMDPQVAKRNPFRPPTYESLHYIPEAFPGIAGSSILKARPWTHLALNEGSFLRAYGTYEYFERGPPSLIYSIKDSLTSPRRHPLIFSTLDVGDAGDGAAVKPRQAPLPSLRSLTYTAILPFATHLDLKGFLPHLDELDVQLAPEPESGILDDKTRVGKAELDDCWHEFLTSYRMIIRPFRTGEVLAATAAAIAGDDAARQQQPRLRRFVCRDFRIPALREDLDEEFEPLCMPVWAEMERGVFERMPDVPAMETRGMFGGEF